MMYWPLVILLSLFVHRQGIVECSPVPECKRGTYHSVVTHGCIECPVPRNSTTTNCQREDVRDLERCERSCVIECEKGVTFHSGTIDGCVGCPRNPTKNCQDEQLEDRETCKRSCIIGSPTKAQTTEVINYTLITPTQTIRHSEKLRTTPAESKEPGYEVATKSNTTLQHPSMGSAGKQNHDKLLVGIGVVAVGIFALGFLVYTCIQKKRKKFRHPTFAGYRLTGRENQQETAPANV